MSAFHGEQLTAQGIHTLTAWEHVDIAARNAGTYAATDVGKVSRVGTGLGPFNFYILKDPVGPIIDANWDAVGTSTGSTVAPLTGRLYVDGPYAGPAVSDGSIAAPFTTIQDALDACNLGGAATPSEEEAQSWMVVVTGGFYDEGLIFPEKRSIWLQGAAGVFLSNAAMTSNRPVAIAGTVLASSNVPYTYTFENIVFSDTVTVSSSVALKYTLTFLSCSFFDPAGGALGQAVDGTGWAGGADLRIYAEKSVIRAFDGPYAIQLAADTQNTAVAGLFECTLEGGLTAAGYGRITACQFGNGPSGTCNLDFNAVGLGLTAVTLGDVDRPIGFFDSQFSDPAQFNDASVPLGSGGNTNFYVDNVSDKSFNDSGGTVGPDTTAAHPLWNASAGGPPTGAAGGDLGSNYPNPTVTSVHSGVNQLGIDGGLSADDVLLLDGAGTSIIGKPKADFGDVTGPGSSITDIIPVFSDASGKVLKESAGAITAATLKVKAAAPTVDAELVLDGGGSNDKAHVHLDLGASAQWTFGVDGSVGSGFQWTNAIPTVVLAFSQSGAITVGAAANSYTLPAARGTNLQVLQTDGSGNVSWAAGGGGDVSGPGAGNSTDTALVRWNGTTGILVQDSFTLLSNAELILDGHQGGAGTGNHASVMLKAFSASEDALVYFNQGATTVMTAGVYNTDPTDFIIWNGDPKDGGTEEVFKVAPTGAVTFNEAYTFPTTDGSSSGEVLTTDGAGNVGWATPAGTGTVTSSASGTVPTHFSLFTTTTDIINSATATIVNAEMLIDASVASLGATNNASLTLTAGSTADQASVVLADSVTSRWSMGITSPLASGNLQFTETATSNSVVMSLSTTGSLTLGNVTGTPFTLPAIDGTVSGQVLTTNAAGDVSWTTIAGTGDVVGPGAGNSTDNALVRWDSTTGTSVQNSEVTLTESSGASGDIEMTFDGATPGAGTSALLNLDHGGANNDVAMVTFSTAGTSKGAFGQGGIDNHLSIQDSAGNVVFTFGTEAAGTPSVLGIGTAASSGFRFPSTDGAALQVLQTDGVGNVTWASVAGTGTVTSSAASTTATQLALMATNTDIYNATEATLSGAKLVLDASGLGATHDASVTVIAGSANDDATVQFRQGGSAKFSVGVKDTATSTDLVFSDSGGTQLMGLSTAGALTIGDDAAVTFYTLPSVRGAALEVLQTDAVGNVSWAAVAGTGDVVGPAGATANAIARFDAGTGKLLQDSDALLVNAALTLNGAAAGDEAALTLNAGATSDATVTLNAGVTGDATLTLAAGAATQSTSLAFQQGSTTVMSLDVAANAITLGLSNTAGVEVFNFSPGGVLTINPAAADAFAFPNADGTVNQVLQTDGAGAVTWATVAGTGDVSGPGAAVTDTSLVRWNTTSGTSVQDSLATLNDGSAVTLTLALDASSAAAAALHTEIVLTHGGAAASTCFLAFHDGSSKVNQIGLMGSLGSTESVTVQDNGGNNKFSVNTFTGAITFNDAYTFPTADGAANGDVLTTDSAGTLSWGAPASGGGNVVGPGSSTSTNQALVRWSGATGVNVLDSEATLTDSSTGSLDLTLTAASAGDDVSVILDHGGAAADTAFLVLKSGGVKRSQIGLLGDGSTTLPGITVQDDAGKTNLSVTYELGAPSSGLHTTTATVDASGYAAGSIASLVLDGGPQGAPGSDTHATLEFKQAGVAGFHFLSRMAGAATTPTLTLRSGFGDDVLQLDASAAGAPTIIINGSDLGGDHWFLPTVDGTVGQVLTTDGTHNSGGVAWQTPAAASSNVEILKADFAFDSAGGVVTVIPDLAVGDVVLQVWLRYTTVFNNVPSTIEVGNTGSADAYFGSADTDPTDTSAGFSTEPVDLVAVGPSPADVIVTITPDATASTAGEGFVCVLVHRA